ncbi:class I SAM-dependent methyltransferase [Phaeacidiphilus oryzae]|uniref:class I SAM-dependent methyltransferase n=1 Tax=Phaeacidiphilus oryzae TaxID=348818 RepID=UPI00068A33E4|nr:class I SAM-dependent methyltransferase [Phaeacidiphilus oryzae]
MANQRTTGTPAEAGGRTAGESYTERLATLEQAGLRRFLPTQLPYRTHLRALRLGRVLDVGCGLGRNLTHLDGQGVGVDHNPTSVAACRERGLTAFTPDEFFAGEESTEGRFDALLCAHVLEHIDEPTAAELFEDYLPCVRPGGRVVLITPQESGYASDPTHIRFVDFAALRAHAAGAGIEVERTYSFPFPRATGKAFKYNEFVLVGRVPQ